MNVLYNWLNPSRPLEPTPAKAHYFSYGSNMSLKRLQERIGQPTDLGPALLHGYRFAFNKISQDGGKANIVEDPLSTVQGVLFEVTNEQLKRLDRFEGAPNHYFRKSVSLTLPTGKTLQAITYIAHKNFTSLKLLKPTEAYLKFIVDGATEHGLPRETIAQIQKQSLLD